MMVNIVLFEPEIPQNTGNIARTCACTGARLHLVEPMGFRLSSKQLGRASMDYWDSVEIIRWPCTQAFLEAHEDEDLHFFTGASNVNYHEVDYQSETFLIFGRESRGIDASILQEHIDSCVRIPMSKNMRSLNLSNAAAIAVYEVLRQHGFDGLE